MTSKPKSRKIPPINPSGEPRVGDQPEPENASAPASESTRKSARKRRAVPPHAPHAATPSAAPARTGEVEVERAVVTVDERLKKLPRLPSLETPVTDTHTAAVTPDTAARPADPSPLPEEEPQPSGQVDRGSTIPDNYGLDRLVVLPRDPHWLYVYWELQGGALDRLRFHHSAEIIDNARWVLRVRAANESRATFVDVDMRIGQWYLHVTPATTFVIDMGLINQNGVFVEVLKGREVSTPRAGVSSVCDERWIILRDELETLLKASGAPSESSVEQPGSVRPPLPRSEQPRALGIFSSYHLQKEARDRSEK
jgi:hypothetical protein